MLPQFKQHQRYRHSTTWCRGSSGSSSSSGGTRRLLVGATQHHWHPVLCRALQQAQAVEPLAQGTCRLKLTVAYDGSNFAGFQYQTPKIRTVQGELERAAARVLLPAGRVVGASRTDGGAHATGAVAHLDVKGSPDSIHPGSLMMYLNGVLPDDVKVQQVEVAPEGSLLEASRSLNAHAAYATALLVADRLFRAGFDSHFSSVGKQYCYKLSGGIPDPLQARQRWWVYERWCERSRGKPQQPADLLLDAAAMQEAAQHLLGVHDFTTFMDVKRPAGLGSLKRKKPKLAALGIKPVRTREKNIRMLWQADVLQEQRGQVLILLAGNGFLYRMVRLIAAGLVEVGHGRLSPAQFKQLLEAADRAALPVEAAPPQGLYLQKVLYELPPGVDVSEAALPLGSTEEEQNCSTSSDCSDQQ